MGLIAVYSVTARPRMRVCVGLFWPVGEGERFEFSKACLSCLVHGNFLPRLE